MCIKFGPHIALQREQCIRLAVCTNKLIQCKTPSGGLMATGDSVKNSPPESNARRNGEVNDPTPGSPNRRMSGRNGPLGHASSLRLSDQDIVKLCVLLPMEGRFMMLAVGIESNQPILNDYGLQST